MGPQPFGCGRMAKHWIVYSKKTGLQWGRNLSVAEGALQWTRTGNGPTTLQWGRNLSVAEGSCRTLEAPHARGFNGAATFRLRKVSGGQECRARAEASMGPQPFGCGRRAGSRGGLRARRASMGPQPFGCGRHNWNWPPASWAAASMGPQPFGCGRDYVRAIFIRQGAASMGPQPFGCGRAHEPTTPVLPPVPLQWGRNLSVAEGGLTAYGTALILPLQWGRNLSVAEGNRPPCKARRPCCFNGAATFRLRKARPAGPGRPPGNASMGPQPFGCGRGGRAAWTGPSATCFNGAATFRLRKDGFRVITRASLRRASMGPQPFGCGRCPTGGNTAIGLRFNGAATFRLRKAAE